MQETFLVKMYLSSIFEIFGQWEREVVFPCFRSSARNVTKCLLGNAKIGGRVRVYEYIGNDWLKRGARIEGVRGSTLEARHFALSSDGSTLAVGFSESAQAAHSSGEGVKVFKWVDGQWSQQGQTISGLNVSNKRIQTWMIDQDFFNKSTFSRGHFG